MKGSRLPDNRWHGPFGTEREAIDRALSTGRQTGQNQGPSFDGLNRHGKLKCSWAVGLGPFKPGQIVRQ